MPVPVTAEPAAQTAPLDHAVDHAVASHALISPVVRSPEPVWRIAPPAIAPTSDPFSSSAEINQLITGLAAAQLAFDAIERSKTAHVDSKRTGVKYTYDYADLAAVLSAVRPALAQNGIAIIQAPVSLNGAVTVTTIVAHTSGQFIRNTLSVKLESLDPQALGSAITYLRRYALQSLLGVAPEDDDDGAGATPQNRRESAGQSGQPNRPGQATVQMPQRSAAAPPAGAPAAASISPTANGAHQGAAPSPEPEPALIAIEALEKRAAASGKPYWVVAFSNGLKGCTFSTTIGEALERGRTNGVRYADVVSHTKGSYTYIDELLPAGQD